MSDIIEKVKKALAIANHPTANEGERMNAMAMASALMTKHAIDQNDLIDKPGVLLKKITVEDADEQWHSFLASATGLLYTVRPVNYGGGTFVFIGRPDQAEASCLMFPWLVEQVEKLYKRDLPKGMTKSARANFRRTFKQAAAATVWQRANNIVQEMRTKDVVALKATGSTALVIVQSIDAQLGEIKDWMEENGFETKQSKTAKLNFGLGSTLGNRAGKEVQINKAVTARPSTTLRLEHKR